MDSGTMNPNFATISLCLLICTITSPYLAGYEDEKN